MGIGMDDELTRDLADLRTYGPIPPATPRAETVARLAQIARDVRMRDAVMIHQAGQGHIGGDYSVIDILVTLYFAVMRYDPHNLTDPERDRLVLSKGHTAGALYTTFAALGVIDPAELTTFMTPLSRLNGHPARQKLPGVEATTGPLGHGLPIAVGMALSGKLDGSSRRTYVITGDGELEEGSNWEALMTAAHYSLDRLTIVVDRNYLQQGYPTEVTTALDPLDAKAAAFGCEVSQVDGHSYGSMLDEFARSSASGKPRLIIAHTTKGFPISFMSGQVSWHHKVPSEDQVRQIARELEES